MRGTLCARGEDWVACDLSIPGPWLRSEAAAASFQFGFEVLELPEVIADMIPRTTSTTHECRKVIPFATKSFTGCPGIDG